MGCCEWLVEFFPSSGGLGMTPTTQEFGAKTMKQKECDDKKSELEIQYPNTLGGTNTIVINLKKGYSAVSGKCEKNKVVTPPTRPTTPKKGVAAWDIDPLTNPIKTINVSVIIGRVVRAILLIIGSIALLMFIYGGFMWMTAAGNDTKIGKAKNVLVWATLGLIVIAAAYLLVKYVMEAVGAI
ncbi:MAG: hypothetical protein UT42_C0019G0002 [Candidatus Falkowbacteria bacterium GW2011_GWA2_39_24]|uniref:Uncharacterized protein n=1 Tax=Candidatus Falkowbacteria bacterium GW2011_GWA2_39_24 TaxID=1618634 RepID=A0A0G0NPQ5_9BACT|nr:MAG: hypothetical protein UT42_C0019G0002 [Candidatus Falkowbacteria bacterium GW2011_GWA2_39_24]